MGLVDRVVWNNLEPGTKLSLCAFFYFDNNCTYTHTHNERNLYMKNFSAHKSMCLKNKPWLVRRIRVF